MGANEDNGDRRPLPEDLAVEILLRLPVKSLKRFECVSKEWYNIIKSGEFIRNWKGDKEPAKILIYDHSGCPPGDDSPLNPKPITLISMSDGAQESPDYMQEFKGMTHLLGCVDGLFLLERVIEKVYNISLSLWNPATGEVRHLPHPNFEIPPCFVEPRDPQYGFGLDTMANDYKVVWLRWTLPESYPLTRPYGAVYSCSKDSWRILDIKNNKTFLYHTISAGLGTAAYLNGSYYWFIRGGVVGRDKCDILSFDLSSEVFEEMPGPDPDNERFNHSDQRLILLDGSIALLSPVDYYSKYNIWVMIQPGIWNKLITFQCTVNYGFIMSWNPTTIIYRSRSDRLISYDVITEKIRRVDSRRNPLLRSNWREGGCSVHIYKESLVTIKRRELDRP